MTDNDLNMNLHQDSNNDDAILYTNDQVKNLLLNLQSNWMKDYKLSREKVLIELTEMLHQNFLTDQQKIRTELLAQFKDELDNTRREMEDTYKQTLQEEIAKLEAQHEQELQSIKRKQWCVICQNEAIFHCCWNTSYCSTTCQESHWPNHRRLCRRRAKK